MTQPPSRENERGIALVLSLMLTLTMSVLAASLMFLSQAETFAGMNYRMMSQARYGAESGVHKAVNYLLNSYVAPGGPGDPLADYDMGTSPVINTVTGGEVVLSANSAVTPNYPNAAMQAAFAAAGQGTLAAGFGTVQFAASARLMSMQVVSGQTITSWEISSDGTIGGARPATVTVTSVLEKQLTPVPGTPYAAFAAAGTCGALTWNNAVVNSYDSTAALGGDNKPVTIDSGGNVGTNGNLHASNNSHIYGSLSTPQAGVGACTAGNVVAATASGAASVHGGIADPLPQSVIVPTPAVPDPAPDPDQNISVNSEQPLAPGTYGNITLTGSPSTILHLTAGTYNINSLNGVVGSRIVIDSSPIIINVVGASSATPFILRSSITTDTAKPYDPKQLLINYAGTAAVTVRNPLFVGQINAPNASVTISSNDYYGAVVGSTVSMMMVGIGSQAKLHFDRNLSASHTTQVGPDMLTSFSWKKY